MDDPCITHHMGMARRALERASRRRRARRRAAARTHARTAPATCTVDAAARATANHSAELCRGEEKGARSASVKGTLAPASGSPVSAHHGGMGPLFFFLFSGP